jgi:protein tyrosine/serine phosphatase
MDDPKSYPVLLHCKAGLHRTGVLSAIYRMEYNGWSRADALRELKAHGFGYFTANVSNPYVQQYLLNYQPRAPKRDSAPSLSRVDARGEGRPVEGILTTRQK